MERNSTYLWMKDLLDHLGSCYDHWENADQRSRTFLADSIRRDLEEFRKLCGSLGPQAGQLRRSA